MLCAVRGALLPQCFYQRDALEVARALLGQQIWCGEIGLRVTEVEAYRHPNDSANHCAAGRTKRNAPMWGPPGHAYVYLCYGLHKMLNFVTDDVGEGAAVLIRACEPIAGEALIRDRRGGKDGPVMLTGPGKVCQALGLDTGFSGQALFRTGDLEVRAGEPVTAVAAGPRIGIGYAAEADQAAAWRLADADSDWVSHRRLLKRMTR